MLAQLQDTETFIWYSEEFGLEDVDDGELYEILFKRRILERHATGWQKKG